MIRIGKRGIVVAMLAASSALFAQSDGLPDRSQSFSDAPDVRRIVELSIAATQRHWRAWLQYTYVRRDENQHLDPAGHVKSADVALWRAIPINGVQFAQLVERNGRAPSAGESWKQNKELDLLKRETPKQRTERLVVRENEYTSLLGEIPRAFDFQLAGEDVLNGRPVWILQAVPHAGYHAQGKYGKMFPKVACRLWVDKKDFAWIKVDGQVIQPISMGLFLARVLPGSRISMEQMRVAEGIWMPEHIEVRAAAKILFMKSLVIARVLTYSEYMPPQAGSATIGDPSIPGK